jgi:hypothetical protein
VVTVLALFIVQQFMPALSGGAGVTPLLSLRSHAGGLKL